MDELESEIAEWRSFVARGPEVAGRDVDELETHLRDQIADLTEAGLSPDEAFIVAIRRVGRLDELSKEFAAEHGGRLWRQLVVTGDPADERRTAPWAEPLGWAIAAAAAIQIARLAAGLPDEEPTWFVRNIGLFVIPFLAAYLARRRSLTPRQGLVASVPFVVAAVVVNIYPYAEGSSTELLVAAHLPVALWFATAYPYVGGTLGSHERRMDFVRFTGEWFIYYVLIGLGGGVLLALTALILEPTGVDVERVLDWVLPSGAAGAVIVAAWLVETKQSVVENMAPVLTMLFTPLFAVMLGIAAVVYAATGLGGAFDRELLGIFDALLVVVLGLVLYGLSARDPDAPAGWADRVRLTAVIAAVVLDAMVLGTMVGRIGELGFTPNRAAALGLNVLLLVGLAGTTWLSLRHVTRRGTFFSLERWQTSYLPVLALWTAFVVIALPPLFLFA